MTDCRGCGQALHEVLADLGTTPLANSYVTLADAGRMEPTFPLRALVCSSCLLGQLEHIVDPAEIFSVYAYFSSWSASWLAHARAFTDSIVDRLDLGAKSFVVEVASNDGYLLHNFVARGIPALGIEPATNVAQAALAAGVPTKIAFFGTELGRTLGAERPADLVIANNVLAHVPDLHDFVGGLAAAIGPEGVVTIEVPHVLRLIAEWQFDTIYHEHYSYFSLLALEPVLHAHGLTVVDVEPLTTHGGSLRLFATRAARRWAPAPAVDAVRAAERSAGLDRIETYRAFAAGVPRRKRDLLRALFDLKDRGLQIGGYGAPAKANTLLNYCGIGTDLVDFTCDANPAKQGHLLPGSRIPVHPPAWIDEARPDVVWVLPWNLRDELAAQLEPVRAWGGRLFFAQPEPELAR